MRRRGRSRRGRRSQSSRSRGDRFVSRTIAAAEKLLKSHVRNKSRILETSVRRNRLSWSNCKRVAQVMIKHTHTH